MSSKKKKTASKKEKLGRVVKLVCLDTSEAFIKDLNRVKLQNKQEKKRDSVANQALNITNLESDDLIIRNNSDKSVVDLVKIKEPVHDVHLQSKKETSKRSSVSENTSVKRKRGRPKNSERNSRIATVDKTAAYPIPESDSLQHLEKANVGETMETENENEMTKNMEDSTSSTKPSFSIKDVRLYTAEDCIRTSPNFTNIDDISQEKFNELRCIHKASFCFKDPHAIFMGIPQKHIIPFHSKDANMDRWPTSFFGENDKIEERDGLHFVFSDSNDVLIPAIYNPQYDGYKKNSESFDAFQELCSETENVDGSRRAESKQDKRKKPTKKKNGRKTYTKTETKRVSSKKKLNPDNQNNEKYVSTSSALPSFNPGSNSGAIVEITRNIVDDQYYNPAYYTGGLTKHLRGLHDSRYSRLFSWGENPQALFKHIDKNQIKMPHSRHEIRSETASLFGNNKFIREMGSTFCSQGATENAVNAGVDYVPYLLGKSTDTMIGMKKEEFREPLQKKMIEYLDMTKNETIPDPANEIKRSHFNFSIIYHPELSTLSSDGKSHFKSYTKKESLLAYSMCDFFSERFSKVSYLDGDCETQSTIDFQEKDFSVEKVESLVHNSGIPEEFSSENQEFQKKIKEKEKKNYFAFITENGFLKSSFFIKFITTDHLCDRIYCMGRKKRSVQETTNENSNSKSNSRKRKSSNERPTKKTKYEHDDENTKEKKEKLSKKIGLSTNETNNSTSCQNRFPLHQFLVDNPNEINVSTVGLKNSLIFDITTNVNTLIPEIVLFVNQRLHPENNPNPRKNKQQQQEKQESGNTVDKRSSISTSLLEKNEQGKDTWVVAAQLKSLLDGFKSNSKCWFPVRRVTSYPPPARKTFNYAKVVFYVSRIRETESTFSRDRPAIIGGSIVTNKINTNNSIKRTENSNSTAEWNETISPFVPHVREIFQQTEQSTENSKERKEIEQDLVSYISMGPLGNCLKQNLKRGVRELAQFRLSTSFNNTITKKSSKDSNSSNSKSEAEKEKQVSEHLEQIMLVSDGPRIGLIHLKSWENLGSFRLHREQNVDLQIVSISYMENQMRPIAPGERPCIRGQSCFCNMSKARQDILESKHQRSQSFVCTEFLLPNEFVEFKCFGILPKKHGQCVICSMATTHLLVFNFMREGSEPTETIQPFAVLVNCKDGFSTRECLPYTYGPNGNFTGIIAPFPMFREQDLTYFFIKEGNCEFKRIRINRTNSHFYMASITNSQKELTKLPLQQKQQQQQQQLKQNQANYNSLKLGKMGTQVDDLLRAKSRKAIEDLTLILSNSTI